MKKIITIIILFLSIIFLPCSNADNSNTSLIKAYNDFFIKLESKFELNKQITILERVKNKIEITLKSKNLSTKSIILLKELNKINDRKIISIKKIINDNNFSDNSQIELEKNEIQRFKNYTIPKLPNYILNTLSANKVYLNILFDEKNTFFEFLDNWKIKRLIFKNFYEINENNYNSLKSRNWYIFILDWKYIFVEEYEIEDKIPYSEGGNYFKWVINNQWKNYFLSNWVYYYFKFEKFVYIKDKYWFYLKNLASLWLNPKEIVLYKYINDYVFINNFTEEKLLKSNIIYNINDKNKFLSFVYEDKKNLDYETDQYFEKLKILTEKLTNWLSNDEKVKILYNYILENITYTNPIDLTRKEIFSWIDTYKNKDWVCEWYVKLMAYMLMFSWIEDVEVIRWFVINAPDFPRIWHAWLKIWDYYYDPTFDDPIWNTITKSYEDYVYFKLPWDLFYTNRYELANLPDEIKTKSKSELTNIVNKNLFNLVEKYKNSWFNLMKYTLLLSEYWLNYNDKITISTLNNILSTYEVNWADKTFIKDNKKIYIKKMMYYKIEDSNIDDLLRTIKYDFNNKYLLKWNNSDWTYEYRLAYEFEIF